MMNNFWIQRKEIVELKALAVKRETKRLTDEFLKKIENISNYDFNTWLDIVVWIVIEYYNNKEYYEFVNFHQRDNTLNHFRNLLDKKRREFERKLNEEYQEKFHQWTKYLMNLN